MYYLLTKQLTNSTNQTNIYDQFDKTWESFFQISHIEKLMVKIAICFVIIIVIKTLIFYTLLNFKKWITPKKFKKNKYTKDNPYAPLKYPKSVWGFCLQWNLYNWLGKLDNNDSGDTCKQSKSNITVASIKRKFTYGMQNKLFKRDSIIALRVYLQEYIPKTNKKYKNDSHYIHSVLKHNKLDYKVLKCFDELMDELAIKPLDDIYITKIKEVL